MSPAHQICQPPNLQNLPTAVSSPPPPPRPVCSVEPTEEGDYQICFDNSFSRFSEKMVFFEVILEAPASDDGGDDEWAGLGEPESLLEYKLEDIRVSAHNDTHLSESYP